MLGVGAEKISFFSDYIFLVMLCYFGTFLAILAFPLNNCLHALLYIKIYLIC